MRNRPDGAEPGKHRVDEPGRQREAGEAGWQSRVVLLVVVPPAAVWAVTLLLRMNGAGRPPAAAWAALGLGAALALLVWRARAATPAGALTGGLLMACFCLTTPGWRSSAWPLLAMLVLTLGATRVGRARKQRLGAAEGKHGRGAAQVAANLGVAALAGTLINVHGQVVALTVLLAALCEAAADTLASELGIALGGVPRMITTLRRVEPGTDGGVTWLGTGLGLLGALVVALVGVAAMRLSWANGLVAAGAGVFGLLVDSLLGATLERAGWLNNDAVNFLSTLAAAGLALGVGEALR